MTPSRPVLSSSRTDGTVEFTGSGSGFADSSGSGFAGSKLVAVECSLSPLTIWLRWEQAVSGGMLTLTSLTI